MIRAALVLLSALALLPAWLPTAPEPGENPQDEAAAAPSGATMDVIGHARPIGGVQDPILFDAANGETFLLCGLDSDQVKALHAPRSPLKVSGAFTWSGRTRILDVEAVGVATKEQVDASRTVEPQYEMANYVMTILRTGKPDSELSAEKKKELFEGHFAHINEQAAAGRLLLAGPFGAPVSAEGEALPRRYRGICIYRADSVADVRKINAGDPTIASGYFETDVVPWFGPASLGY